MNTLKKFVTALALGVGIFFVGTGDLVKASSTEEEYFTERIKGIEFEIPYEENEVYTEKVINGSVGSINVYDQISNELLETFSVEDVEEPINQFNPLKMTTLASTPSTSLKNVSKTRYDNNLGTQLRARIEVYSSGSFRQINRVLSTQWFAVSGIHTIENATADVLEQPRDFPRTSINVLGDATIQVETDINVSGGWEAAGFSAGVSVGQKKYYRKYIELGFKYSVY